MQSEELNEKISELLFEVYKDLPFKKLLRSSKNIRDVFNHRVRSASRKATLEEFISKLSNYFSIQNLAPSVTNIIKELKPYEEEVLEKLYKEHIYQCSLAFLKYDEYKKLKKEAKKDEV